MKNLHREVKSNSQLMNRIDTLSEADVKDLVDSTKEKLNRQDYQQDVKIRKDDSSNNKDTQAFCPFVYWSQSKTHVTLRVNLVEASNFETHLEHNRYFSFSAKGRGAQGLQSYKFYILFYDEVEVENIRPIERHILILVKKKDSLKWPRLTKGLIKLPWLRIDFDLYDGDESDDSADSDFVSRDIDKQSVDKLLGKLKDSDQPIDKGITSSSSWKESLERLKSSSNNFDIFNPFNRRYSNLIPSNMNNHQKDVKTDGSSKNTARQSLDLKKTYLFLYNVMMFIMFLKVFTVLVIKGSSGTTDDDIIQGTAFIIKLLTYIQLLETFHTMIGLVPGGPFMAFLQVFGRLTVNHFLSEQAIRVNASPYVFSLFIVWSSIEIFRYSFYALRIFKVNIYPLTWCRYSLFLPLYPMGGFCESMVLFSTIEHYGKTGQYSYSLPNSLNISFNLPLVLKTYIYFLLGPGIYLLMKYMWKQRCKQLKAKIN